MQIKENEQQEKIKEYVLKNDPKEIPARITTFGPVFYQKHNFESAKDTKTDYLQPGGESNLNLTGEGLHVGVWDEGHVLKEHVEFQNISQRVIIGNDINYEKEYNSHATHVAGTIGASGVVNSESRGMATKSIIHSYDWSFWRQEILKEEASNITIANFSFGLKGFNDNGTPAVDESYFGTYDDTAEDLDNIHIVRPYLLVVCSVGNDGNEKNFSSLYQNFDLLTDNSTAKNNLVVANAQNTLYFASGTKIIRINSSSSRGPTNDLRIKPDITAIGTNVLSTEYLSSNPNTLDEYSRKSGSSMSSPNAAGAALLLQEYYSNTKNKIPLSSTIKALIINTAVDAGDSGPDPTFGWGLLNTKESAIIISNNISNNTIIEDQLFQGQEKSIPLDFENNPEKGSITICWTDPAAQSLENALDKDIPVLVNDLDIRVIENNTIEHFPYKISVSQKMNNNIWAEKTDNNVDNLERIDFDINPNSSYKLIVSHKGTITNETLEESVTKYQNFSLVASTGIKFDTTLSANNNLLLFENYINAIAKNGTIQLTNISEERMKRILMYSIDGKKLFAIKTPNALKEYSIDFNERVGILVVEFDQFRVVKKIGQLNN